MICGSIIGCLNVIIWYTNTMNAERFIDDLIGFKVEDHDSNGSEVDFDDDDNVHITGKNKDVKMM